MTKLLISSSSLLLVAAISILPLITTTVYAQKIDASTYKYKFFCGASFADIQADTCHDRQWCPSSSDDECLVPGHTCFANSPCDARTIENVQVPTYSLSLHPEYRNPTDKMFCGTDYGDATRTCEAGGDEARGRHCPDMECPTGQTCFVDLPCSYWVLTDPLSNPLNSVHDMEVTEEELDLPKPGSMESNYFCGPTFQQAAATCSSTTWCRTGTSQECPNGETCFVSVNTENENCEINAIVKAEYGLVQEAAEEEADRPIATIPTLHPTNPILASNDPKNKMFCGETWNDASENCELERFCGYDDSVCPEGMECFDYTNCHAGELTFKPTQTP